MQPLASAAMGARGMPPPHDRANVGQYLTQQPLIGRAVSRLGRRHKPSPLLGAVNRHNGNPAFL